MSEKSEITRLIEAGNLNREMWYKAVLDRDELIADLLAACEDYVQLYCDSDMRPEDECADLYSRMQAAIAKAKQASGGA